MNNVPSVTREELSATILAIDSFEESKKLRKEEVEELAKKAILLQKTKDKEWLILELDNFYENQKKEEEKEKVKLIKPTEPVKIENKKDLDRVLKEHKIWMNSVLGSGDIAIGTRANLNGSDLSGFTLKEVNLSCANLDQASFIGAKLTEINFSRASFKKTSFQGATIENCSFHKADLLGADFTEADMSDSFFSEEQKKEAIGLF